MLSRHGTLGVLTARSAMIGMGRTCGSRSRVHLKIPAGCDTVTSYQALIPCCIYVLGVMSRLTGDVVYSHVHAVTSFAVYGRNER